MTAQRLRDAARGMREKAEGATWRVLIGCCLIASPFVALFVFLTLSDGVWTAAGVLAGSAAIAGVVIFGCELMVGGPRR